MWLYPIILLELIILSIAVYFIIRLVKKEEIKPNIEKSVKEGVKSAIKELEEEKESEEELFRTIKSKEASMGVFSSNDLTEEPINSGGELIPAHLTNNEKNILRMFYNQ